MRTQVAGIPRRHPSCPSCQHKLFPTDCQNRFQLCLPRQFHSVHQPIGYLLLYTSLQLDCFLHNHVHKFYQWSNEVSNLPAVKHLKKQRAPKNAERQYVVIFLSTNLGSPRLRYIYYCKMYTGQLVYYRVLTKHHSGYCYHTFAQCHLRITSLFRCPIAKVTRSEVLFLRDFRF